MSYYGFHQINNGGQRILAGWPSRSGNKYSWNTECGIYSVEDAGTSGYDAEGSLN